MCDWSRISPQHWTRTKVIRTCPFRSKERKGNVLFNDTLNTLYLRLYGIGQIARKETCCHMGYSFWLAARGLLYAPSHRQDSTHHSLCYTSRGALASFRSSMQHNHYEVSLSILISSSSQSYTFSIKTGLYYRIFGIILCLRKKTNK